MDDATARLVRRHLTLGWIFIPAFMLLGLTLETLHGFKVGWYLSVANETRRFLWTLAHAHGVLLGVVNVALALSLKFIGTSSRLVQIGSRLVVLGSILLPFGFLLGGVVVYGGDPGVFIVLAPAGGVLLILGIAMSSSHIVSRIRAVQSP